MLTNMEVKVGDTFDFNGAFPIVDHLDVPVAYSEWTITSVVTLFGDGRRKVSVPSYWLDTFRGVIRVVGPTDDWSVGPAQIDVKFTSPQGTVISTETQTFRVLKD